MKRRSPRRSPIVATCLAVASAATPLVVMAERTTLAGTSGDETTRQPLEAITTSAIDHLRHLHGDDPSLRVEGGALDSRLRLRSCDAPLAPAIAPGSGDIGLVTVQVRCPTSPGWRVHVRLDVSRERTVWTFARAARRGEVLRPELLERTTVTLGRGESRLARAGVPIDVLDAWLGHELARDVVAGRPLVAAQLVPRRLIERGSEVRLRAGGAGLAIETIGEALADAALDERVPVRNRASGRIVEAIVTGRGRAEIRIGR